MRSILTMLSRAPRAQEAEAVSAQIRIQRMRLEAASRNLVNTLDEMIQATQDANRRNCDVNQITTKRDN